MIIFICYLSKLISQVVLQGSDDIASRAIELLKETFTSLGPKLRANQVQIHLFTSHTLSTVNYTIITL